MLDWATAYSMVYRSANVREGQRVFMHGVSGAVGYAPLKLCQLRSASAIYGTASARNHKAMRSLGVTPFVYTDKNWIATMRELGGAHAVFDPLGFDSFDESYTILANDPGSILVGYGENKSVLQSGADNQSSSCSLSPFPHLAKMLARTKARTRPETGAGRGREQDQTPGTERTP